MATSVNQSSSSIEQLINQGESLVEILRKSKFDVSLLTMSSVAAAPMHKVENVVKTSKQASLDVKKTTDKKRAVKKRHLRQAISRRRRPRRRGGACESSEEEEDEKDSDSSSDSSSILSGDILSDNLGEDDLEMLEKLSEYSSSEDEDNSSSSEKTPPRPTLPSVVTIESPPSTQKKAKRQIILAANFSNVTPKVKPKIETEPVVETSPLVMASADVDTTAVDDSLRYLMETTRQQSVVHSACGLIATVSYLMPLRLFMEWIQSYPIIIATSSQVCMWTYVCMYLAELF